MVETDTYRVIILNCRTGAFKVLYECDRTIKDTEVREFFIEQRANSRKIRLFIMLGKSLISYKLSLQDIE